jgi:putative heme-binding domain-containing protein
MAADTGEVQPMGAAYFERNPKYGKAVREMFEAAPLVERMHHAQMLLWLADRWTPEQSRRYFQLLADAVVSSKGGHRYAEFWNRIREAALARIPETERAAFAAVGAESSLTPADASVRAPKGPGREWSVEEALDRVNARLSGRDFENGKAMYSATGCVTCHRLGDEGGAIGPDLTGVGQRFNLRDILEAVIDPSRTISDQYRMMLLKTNDGQTHSGRILSRDDEATRLAPNLMRPSQTIAVPNNLITSEQALPVSIMPSGLVNALNEDELLDLVAYLISGADPAHAVYNERGL